MASIIARKNKHGKVTSYGFSVSNYPHPPVRLGGFKNKGEAIIVAKEVEEKIKEEKMRLKLLKVGYEKRTFINAFEKWMNENKLHLHPKTIQAYINTKGKIENHFKDTLLKDMTKEAYKEFLKTFDYLNQTTNLKMHKQIREFAKSAFEGQLITSNFTSDVTVRGKKSKAIKQYLTSEEYERFIRFIYDTKIDLKLKLMILIPTLAGVRYGELCAICWDDIDFDKNLLHVHRQWDYVKGNGFTGLKDPLHSKNEGEIKERYLPLPMQLVELLKTYKSSPEYTNNKDSRLFYKHGTTAQALSNSAYNDNLDLLLSKLNIPRITCHKLRHSYATNLVKLKVSKEAIQYLMGHESYETTEKYYVHLDISLFEKEFTKISSPQS